MYRPGWWRLLLGLRPVQRVLTREIGDAVDRAFEKSTADRRAMLRAADERAAALEREITKLRQHIDILAGRAVKAEDQNGRLASRVLALREQKQRLEAENNELARRNATLRKRAMTRDTQRWTAVLSPENTPVRPPAGGSGSGTECDVFACLDCGSLLILETPAADEPRWHRPAGEGCGTCVDLPCSRPPAPSVAEAPAVPETELPVPGTAGQRAEIAAELVAGLAKSSPADVAADELAKKAAEATRDVLERISPAQSSSLDALATGLEKVSGTVRSGIAWCATELLGMPDFLGTVLGHVVAELVTDPLHVKEIARAVRVVDTVACAVEGDLSKCASLRHLAIMDLGQAEAADRLKALVHDPKLDERLKDDLIKAIALQKAAELAKPVERPVQVEKPARWFKPEPELDHPVHRGPGGRLFGR